MREVVAQGVVVWHNEAGIGNERYSVHPDVTRRKPTVDSVAVFMTGAAVSQPTRPEMAEPGAIPADPDIIVSVQPSDN